MMHKYLLVLFMALTEVGLQAQTLNIVLENIRSSEGEISLTVYEYEDTWLDENIEANVFSKSKISDGMMMVRIELEHPGLYAVAVLDDEDADGRMRSNLIGYPREGFGFSNNVHVRFSRPEFDECVMEVKSDTTIHIRFIYK